MSNPQNIERACFPSDFSLFSALIFFLCMQNGKKLIFPSINHWNSTMNEKKKTLDIFGCYMKLILCSSGHESSREKRQKKLSNDRNEFSCCIHSLWSFFSDAHLSPNHPPPTLYPRHWLTKENRFCWFRNNQKKNISPTEKVYKFFICSPPCSLLLLLSHWLNCTKTKHKK